MKRLIVPIILPLVVAWARHHERRILRRGAPLDAAGLDAARRAGVQEGSRVRTLAVDCVPPRLPRWLRRFAGSVRWGPATTAGMALGHGVFLRTDQLERPGLLLHELAHVAQYERLGFRVFLRMYLEECLTAGYPLGALESEARRIECELP